MSYVDPHSHIPSTNPPAAQAMEALRLMRQSRLGNTANGSSPAAPAPDQADMSRRSLASTNAPDIGSAPAAKPTLEDMQKLRTMLLGQPPSAELASDSDRQRVLELLGGE